MKYGCFLALLLLAGCASFKETVKRHPYVTSFVVTSLVISGARAHLNKKDTPDRGVQPTICNTNPASCQ